MPATSSRRWPVSSNKRIMGPYGVVSAAAAFHTFTTSASVSTRSRCTLLGATGSPTKGFPGTLPRRMAQAKQARP